jgi:hypothetical protein
MPPENLAFSTRMLGICPGGVFEWLPQTGSQIFLCGSEDHYREKNMRVNDFFLTISANRHDSLKENNRQDSALR